MVAIARVFVAVCIVLAIAGIARAQLAADDFLVVPGDRIGTLRVGMPLSDAESRMGEPKSTFQAENSQGTIETWFATIRNRDGTQSMGSTGGLYAVVDSSGTIRQAGVHYDSRFVTSSGLHTGVSETEVRTVQGEPSVVYQHQGYHELAYAALGITFSVVDDPKLRGYRSVYEIAVYSPQR
ncbi:MAG TPA: hypothetical protein VEP50_14455 [bacterium]|nr:hypothetical protein [bacterium]